MAAQAQRALSLWCLLGVLGNAAWLTSFAGQRGRVTLCGSGGGADKRPGVNFVRAEAHVEWRLRTFPPLGEMQKSALELAELIYALFSFFWSIFIFIGLFENPAATLETSVAGGIAFKYCVREETRGRGAESKHKTKAGEENKKKSPNTLCQAFPQFVWKAPPKIQV